MEVLREYEAMYEEYLKIEPELDHDYETHHTPDVIVVSCSYSDLLLVIILRIADATACT